MCWKWHIIAGWLQWWCQWHCQWHGEHDGSQACAWFRCHDYNEWVQPEEKASLNRNETKEDLAIILKGKQGSGSSYILISATKRKCYVLKVARIILPAFQQETYHTIWLAGGWLCWVESVRFLVCDFVKQQIWADCGSKSHAFGQKVAHHTW
jgi:hypothetical protein